MPSSWTTRLVGLAGVALFAVPLFIGLDRWDLRNDEAIYSYAVNRMLDTGDWLTPRASPTDFVFLEKPPLKIWLVAGLMKAGLVPRDEFGMRVLDAVFGGVIFAYVFAFGARLAGPVAGLVAMLLLFGFEPLLFDHGLRSNNMEAALTLAYAGGLWHTLRWADNPASGSHHAWLATGFFVLGFMTKSVAVAFLPAVALASWLWRPGGALLLRQHWRGWLVPGLAGFAVAAPWFVYQSAVHGWGFWQELLGHQVLQRFTVGVDPAHLEPWSFYFAETWRQLGLAGSSWLIAGGAVLLAWKAFGKADLTARLLVIWWVGPIVAISFGSSKLLHYVFPFLPPLALAGGLLTGGLLAATTVAIGDVVRRFDSAAYGPGRTRIDTWLRRHRGAITVVALASVAVAAWTFIMGPVHLQVGGTRIFRNSSVMRPALVGIVLLGIAGRVRLILHGLAVVIVLLALPLDAYPRQLAIARSSDHPLSALTSCLTSESRTASRPGVVVEGVDELSHPFHYYLSRIGPWQTDVEALEQAQRSLVAGDPIPFMLLRRPTWRTMVHSAPGASELDSVLLLSDDRVLIVPTSDWVCLSVAVEAGGHRVTRRDVLTR